MKTLIIPDIHQSIAPLEEILSGDYNEAMLLGDWLDSDLPCRARPHHTPPSKKPSDPKPQSPPAMKTPFVLLILLATTFLTPNLLGQTPQKTGLVLTGYALIGKTPFAALFDPTTQKHYGLTTASDILNNKILEFHAKDTSLHSVEGLAQIDGEIRAFSGNPKTANRTIPPRDLGAILIYPSPDQAIFWEDPMEAPASEGQRAGRLAALQTLVLLEMLEIDDPQTHLHLFSNPLPENPTPEMLGSKMTTWKNTKVPLYGKPHQTYTNERDLDIYYQNFLSGWKAVFMAD